MSVKHFPYKKMKPSASMPKRDNKLVGIKLHALKTQVLAKVFIIRKTGRRLPLLPQMRHIARQAT